MKTLSSLRNTLVVFISASLFFSSCQNSEPKIPENTGSEPYADWTLEQRAEYAAQGKEYALATFKVLGGNLKSALQKGGPEHALAFCNVRALPLTDSMSTHLGVYIKRVTDFTRNPANAANAEELTYIQHAKKTLAEGGELKPQITLRDNRVIGYYPITTNSLCLSCHGTVGQTVTVETAEVIKKYYPEDQALGYVANQVRGIWVVDMEK